MIALDTNLLVYAYDEDADDHNRALAAVTEVAESPSWALPWSVVHEYLKVLTDRRLADSVSFEAALRSVEAYLASPGVNTLAEPAGYWRALRPLLAAGNAKGSRVFDARIAATCLAHGVSELWTADRHFGRFPGLRTRNPLVG